MYETLITETLPDARSLPRLARTGTLFEVTVLSEGRKQFGFVARVVLCVYTPAQRACTNGVRTR